MTSPPTQAHYAFICAMPMELTPVVEKMGLTETAVGDVTMHAGKLGDRHIVAIVTGMGLQYATDGTTNLLDAIPVAHVVVVGITGAVENETPIGTVMLPEVVVHSQSGAEYRPTPLGGGTHAGKMYTAVDLTSQPGRIEALRDEGVVALDMETAAIAHLCEERGIPWSVFRAISDRPADGIDEELFQMSNMDGTPNHAAATAYFEKYPERVEMMAHLAAQATLAADSAADAAFRACSQS
jgi:adenosylhomocysteine nucleosidase